MLKVINLFGGPGTGKSTTATGLFHLMKLDKMECEYVSEFAKDVVWEQNTKLLENQFFVSANQHHKIFRVLQYYKNNNIKNAYVITDSPFVLGIFYGNENWSQLERFNDFLVQEFKTNDMSGLKMQNINIFLNRVKEYNPKGRLQSEKEAKKIDTRIKNFLNYFKIPYIEIDADENAPKKILEIIKDKEK